MPSQILTLAFASAAVVLVVFVAHPRREQIRHVVSRTVLSAFLRLQAPVERLRQFGRVRDKTGFCIGSAIGFSCAVVCVLVLSRRVLGDVVVLGFPFIFRTAGGYVFAVYWDWLAVLADLLFVAALAVLAGYAAAGLRKGLSEGERTI